MALSNDGYSFHQSYIGFRPETVFGTAQGDSSVFQILKVIGGAHPKFDPTDFQDTGIRNQVKDVADIEHFFKTDGGMIHRYQIPEFIGNADVIAKMLYLITQNVAEGGTTPFNKTFTLDGDPSNWPDFSADAGYFGTWLFREPIASESAKLTSGILESLVIKFSPLVEGGRAVVSGTIVGGSGYGQQANPSGANALSTVVAPNAKNTTARTLTVNSIDLSWNSVEFNINQSLSFAGYEGGNAENIQRHSIDVMVKAVVKYDGNSDALLRSKGTDVNAISFTLGGGGSNIGDFSFDTTNAWLVAATGNNPVDDLQNVTLEMKSTIKSSASESMNWQVADGVDQTWPA